MIQTSGRPVVILFVGIMMTAFLSVPGAMWGGTAAARTRIGQAPEEFAFRDVQGNEHTLGPPQALAAVYLFLSTQCPVSNLYTSRILELDRRYRPRGIKFFGVYSNSYETVAGVREHARDRGFRFPIVKDSGALATRLGAAMTPAAIVLDSKGCIRYRGRIDDNKDASEVRSHDLQAALDALLTVRPILSPETSTFGCAIQSMASASAKQARITYVRDAAPILHKHCVVCHRAGEVGPFSLETYAQAATWAKQIKSYTQKRTMPPWKADSHGEFYDERRLTEGEIATLAEWADEGAPLGESNNSPALPSFSSGWKLGSPDHVAEMPETFSVPADGKDIYQCFVIPTDFDEDRYVSATEVQPGNRSVVHHVLIYLDTSGEARKLDAADPAPGFTNPTPGNAPGFQSVGLLGGWAPGNEARTLPSGVGIRLPKGADMVLEVHYHKTGKVERDRTRFGIHFVRGAVEKSVEIAFVGTREIRIPPHDSGHVIETSGRLLEDEISIHSVTPHMHMIGRSMLVRAVLPNGTVKRLIYIPDWDFNWQITYHFKDPVKLPKGAYLNVVARYDNSAENPHNPTKPPREVKWGEQTTDEMCVAFFGITKERPRPPQRAQ